MTSSTLISVRLPSDLVQKLDQEAELLSRPGAKVTRTDLLTKAGRAYFGESVAEAVQSPLLDEPVQKPYKCPGVGCNMRTESKAATCPTHGRRVVPA
jgi:hypothetical protein